MFPRLRPAGFQAPSSARRQLLHAWYRTRRRAGDSGITEVGTITTTMLGEEDHPQRAFKGAERWHVPRLLLDELAIQVLAPGLLQAGRYLVRMKSVWDHASWKLTAAKIRESWD